MTTASGTLAQHPAADRRRKRIAIAGTVQGVGFRPFLYRRALVHGLAGFAVNSPDGVLAEVEGTEAAITAFLADIESRAPGNAVIRDIAVTSLSVQDDASFTIRESRLDGAPTASVLPDLATCDACLAEIFDPRNRRYLYPFTNCTDCGPRYSIIRDLPYDRARTAMERFAMCPACKAEYGDPADRRFHAEPNACPDCGPQPALWDCDGRDLAARHAALEAAAEAIHAGRIVAVKGLGGFHLVVDACNAGAIARLRVRKGREEKPFAVMLSGLEAARDACHMSAEEERLLAGRERPIVLLRRRADAEIAPGVAPENPYLGVMLPYTPLHHILMASLERPVVATSGNLAGEPIAIDNTDALARLGGIADLFLLHDRPILRPVDDSLTRIIRGRPQILRRARGYAPAPIPAPGMPAGILAMGGHLKAAIAVTQENAVILSQHIGDLDTPMSRDSYGQITEDLLRLYDIRPGLLACDRHPDYHSTREAEKRAEAAGLPLARIQHHLAHVTAGMAEHGLAPPVLGIAWDGTGYGSDGAIWGGECLEITQGGWRRAARLRPFRLPGGCAAIREPRRAAFGLLYEMMGEAALDMDHLPPIAAFTAAECRTLAAMMQSGTNAPETTSAGRLFDAVAALLGLRQTAAYEGQAACLLEWAAGSLAPECAYCFALTPAGDETVDWEIDWSPAIKTILGDIGRDVPTGEIAARFHAGLAAAIRATAEKLEARTVMLTGGCFQNRLLCEWTIAALEDAGIRAFWHEIAPPGDGGLALGQAWWAARMMERGEVSCA